MLGHADLVADRRGAAPILLLDEVAAHLDPGRRAALFARLEGRGQVWMTATEPALFEGIASATHYAVAGGQIAPDNQSGFVRRTKNWTNARLSPIWSRSRDTLRRDRTHLHSMERAPAVSRSDFSPSSPNHAGRNVPAADVRTSARVPASKVFPITTFATLGLSKPVLDALASKNYNVPTPIQAQAIPTVLSGRDLLGIAQTGTGKTAAFMLPSIDRLVASAKRPQGGRCRMLVLAPTRELPARSPKARSIMRAARGCMS